MTTENLFGQILEVLTPSQGYLMFFNNRGLTDSPTCVLSNPYTSFQTIPFFSMFVLCSSSSCHISKDTWSRSCHSYPRLTFISYVHRCIGYRSPTNSHFIPTSVRLMYLSMYDIRDRVSENTPSVCLTRTRTSSVTTRPVTSLTVLSDWWKSNSETLPGFAYVLCVVLTSSPNSWPSQFNKRAL